MVVDGDLKIYGIFDGHGQNGHLISNFVMGSMLDYVKNSKVFRDKDINNLSEHVQDAEMTKAIRCCFKYAQEKVKDQYYDYLMNEKKKKVATENYNRAKKMKDAKHKASKSSMQSSISQGKHINDVGLDEDESNKNNSFDYHMNLLEEDDISIDQDELDFINNFSWDTQSDVSSEMGDDDESLDSNGQRKNDHYCKYMHQHKRQYNIPDEIVSEQKSKSNLKNAIKISEASSRRDRVKKGYENNSFDKELQELDEHRGFNQEYDKLFE